MLRESNRQETHDAIIDAAERLLDRYGYSKMTMTDLADEAGIGVGTTYLYFPGKVEVALAVLERLTASIRQRLHEIAASSDTAAEKLKAMLTDRLMIRYESVRTRRHQIDEFKRAVQCAVDERRAGWLAAEAEILTAALEEGRQTGVFEFEDATETTAVLMRTTSSLTPRNLSQHDLEHPEEFRRHVAQVVALLLRGLRPEESCQHVNQQGMYAKCDLHVFFIILWDTIVIMPNDDEPAEFSARDHFFGTATVGERGQIVIPAEARKKHQITPGDKLLIMGTPDRKGIMLIKIDAMREFMTNMLQELQRVEQEPQDHSHDRTEEKSS